MLSALRSFSPSTQMAVLLGSIYFYIGIFAPFFPLWLASRGLNPGEIGLVLAAPIASRIIGNPSLLWLANRRQSVSELIVFSALASLVGFAGLLFCHSFWPLLIVTGLTFLFQGPMMPLSDVLILDQVARDDRLHYGSIRSWGSVAVLVSMLLAGVLAGVMPNEGVIWFLIVAAGVQALTCVGILSGDKAQTKAAAVAVSHEPIERFDLVAIVIVAASLVQSSHSMVSSFGPIYYHALGYSDLFIGWSWALGVFTEIIMFLVAGRFLGGTNNAITFFVVGACACMVRWLVSGMDFGTTGIVLAMGSHGLTFCATHLGTMYLLAKMVPSTRLAQMQGLYAGANSLFTAGMTALSGPIYQNFSGKGMMFMIIPALIGLLMIAYVSRERRKELTP